MTPSKDISRLIEIMAALRTPVTGCPWDLEQDFKTIAPYTIEEAYEVADAIERGDFDDLRDELGDLLLQVAFHARMAEERGSFAFGDVVQAITAKLIRRHPHVFGPDAAADAKAVRRRWEAIKAEERADKAVRRGAGSEAASLLDDVPRTLPGLNRAEKLTRRAASVGFDWPDKEAVLAKVREELDETEAAIAGGDRQAMQEEIGDLLFAIANLARHAGIDAETALLDANSKFTRRFRHVEARADEDGVKLAEAGLERLDGYWNEVRARDKAAGGD